MTRTFTEVIAPGIVPRYKFYSLLGHSVARSVDLNFRFPRRSSKSYSLIVPLFFLEFNFSKSRENGVTSKEYKLQTRTELNREPAFIVKIRRSQKANSTGFRLSLGGLYNEF